MTNTQQNQHKMYGVTLQFFTDHPEVLTGRKTLSDLVTEATGILTNISILDTEIEENRNAGVYGGKSNTRALLHTSVFSVQKSILVYATLNKDATLAGLMKYQKSDLKNMSDSEFETAASLILKKAKEQLPNLKDVNVTQEDLTEMETLLTDFSGKKSAPRTQIVNRSEKIKMMGDKFDRMVLIFEMIDALMEKLAKTDVSLYHQFKSARRIENRGGRQRKTLTPEEMVKKEALKQAKLLAQQARQATVKAKEALKQAQADADKLAKFEGEKAAALKEAEQFEAVGAVKSSNGIEKEVEAG